MAYCKIEEVSALTQPEPPYSDSTAKPSEEQVTTFISLINGEINSCIRARGYVLPIEDEVALEFLKMVNAFGAAWLAEGSQQQAGNPDGGGWSDRLRTSYREALDMIKNDPGVLGDTKKLTESMRSMWTSNKADGTDPEFSSIEPGITLDGNF